MKAWMALRPKKQDREQDTAELICTALEARKVEWADRDQKFIPLPATWLRRESFEESEVLGGTA